MSESSLIDQNATAALIGLKNPRTLCEWRRRRCGPPFKKIGQRLVRYERGEVLAWIAAGCPVALGA